MGALRSRIPVQPIIGKQHWYAAIRLDKPYIDPHHEFDTKHSAATISRSCCRAQDSE
jgi:hypothetical protein